MNRILFAIVGLTMAALAVDGYSAWGSVGSGSCLIRTAPLFTVAVADAEYQPGDVYEWRGDVKNADQAFLYRNGVLVGGWRHDTQSFCEWSETQGWGKFCKPPIDAPISGVGARPEQATKDWQTHGVNQSKCNGHDSETFSLSGRPIVASEAYELITDSTLIDDSDKLHLIVITKSSEMRAKILADYATLPKDFRDHTNVWAAPPDHFSMMDRSTGKPRFVADQDPTIILEDARGVVLCRHPNHATGAAYQGVSDLNLLLKADPNYKPAVDPGLPTSGPTLSELSETEIAVIVALTVIGIVLLLAVFRRK